MSADWPEDKYIENLKPSLIRYGNFSVYKRAKKWNARFMLLLYGEYPGIYINGRLDKNGNWPGDNDNWEEWDEYVTKIVKQARRQGYDDVIWEVWNEPDIDIFWKRSYKQFLQTYEHTVKLIRRLIPNALVTGPGFAVYDERKINEFLKFAKEHDVLPDIINWHEIPDAPDGIPERVNKIKKHLKKSNINIDRFMFPEITHPDFQFSPGNAVCFIANIHRSGVEASAKSCWPDVTLDGCVENCFTDTLDGLLHPLNGEPRSIWWCYKKYAEMSGFFIPFTVSDTNSALDGIATYNAALRKAFILCGRSQSNNVLNKRSRNRRTQDIVIEIQNIPQALISAESIHIVAKKIPDTGADVLKEPLLIIDADKQISGRTMHITLPAMGPEDVYVVIVTHPTHTISVREQDFSTDFHNYYIEKVFNNTSYWNIYTDQDVKDKSFGQITVKAETIKAKKVETLTMGGRLSGTSENPFVVFSTSIWVFAKEVHKASGIRFRVAGDRGSYRVEFVTPNVKDYCYHGKTFQTEQKQIKEITVYFNEVEQESWGKQVPFKSNTIIAINFVFDGRTVHAGRDFKLTISNFEILRK
jgi:xylan 1,4-beta-xylosidase